MPTHPPRRYLSMFSLAMLNVAAVMSLRGLPVMAATGFNMFFYLLFSSLFFLIPCSLVAAELATGWPERGGVYRWVKEAFGSRWGFLAIWLQWVENVVWYPLILTFVASAFAYALGKPSLTHSTVYNVTMIMVVYWFSTFLTFRGFKLASKVASAGVMLGTIVPAALLIGLGVSWVMIDKPIGLMQGSVHFLPNLSHFSNIAFLASIVLLFAGMEVGAVHVANLKNPQKQYPRAVFLATFIIIIIFALGAFSIALMIPKGHISFTAGLMEAFRFILQRYHLEHLIPLSGLLVTFGGLAGVLAWISGPSKGLLATAREGEIPPILARTNAHGIQVNILWVQGALVTLLISLFFVIDNLNVVFFLLSAMSVTLYLVMYLLMFAAAIRLRYTQPDVKRAYQVPGGKLGMWLVSGIGFFAVLFALVVGFLPPESLEITTPALYVFIISLSLLGFIGMAFIIHASKKEAWLKDQDQE